MSSKSGRVHCHLSVNTLTRLGCSRWWYWCHWRDSVHLYSTESYSEGDHWTLERFTSWRRNCKQQQQQQQQHVTHTRWSQLVNQAGFFVVWFE